MSDGTVVSAVERLRASVVLRMAKPEDGPRLHALVEAAGTLEQNTLYCYVLMADHFRATTVVAEREGELVGFVMAHRPPTHPEAVFVWQVGVHPRARGLGVGRRMLRFLADHAPGVRFVEATVTPSNEPSRRLFESLARELGVPASWNDAYDARHLGAEHEPERLIRIGPLYPRLVRNTDGTSKPS